MLDVQTNYVNIRVQYAKGRKRITLIYGLHLHMTYDDIDNLVKRLRKICHTGCSFDKEMLIARMQGDHGKYIVDYLSEQNICSIDAIKLQNFC